MGGDSGDEGVFGVGKIGPESGREGKVICILVKVV